MMKNRIIPVFCIAVSIVGMILLFIGAKGYRGDEFKKTEEFEYFAERIKELEETVDDAEQNLFNIEKSIDSVEKKATVSLIMRGMREEIYTQAFPVFKEYGIVGTLAISKDCMPGGKGLLNDAQILEMSSAGWKLIPEWCDGDGEYGITASSRWIRDYGYDFEGAVLIDSSAHTPELEEMLKGEGYTTVITDVLTGDESCISTSEVGEVWRLYAMGYNCNGAKGILNSSIETYGNIVFTVGFEAEAELYVDTTFNSMLDYLKKCEKAEYVHLGSLSDVRSYREEMDRRIKDTKDSFASQIAENEKIIEDAQASIKALYDEYNG